MMNNKIKIVFLGTPDFALPFLQALVASDMKPVLVITQPDKPVGRKQEMVSPPVKLPALMEHIPVKQPETKKELRQILEEVKPDVCILVAYGMMIGGNTLEIPKFGFVNAHPSMLPKFRGSSPVQSAILSGDEFSGVTIMRLDSEMDHGPIIIQDNLPILETDTYASLADRLAIFGSELLIKSLPNYLSGKIKLVEQNHELATYTEMINREDGKVDWQKAAVEIERQFRAYSPWPGIFTHLDAKRLKLGNLELIKANLDSKKTPGTIFLTQKSTLGICCGKDAVSIGRVQLEGKKEISAQDFVRGNQTIIGTVLD